MLNNFNYIYINIYNYNIFNNNVIFLKYDLNLPIQQNNYSK